MKIEKHISPKFASRNSNGYFYLNHYDNFKVFYTESELEKNKIQMQTILNNEGNGKIGKILYVGKGSNAPRHKIKMLVEENKIKKTSLIENSDTVIFDKQAISDLYDWFKSCKKVKITFIPFTKDILDVIVNIGSLSNQNYYNQTFIDLFQKGYNLVIYENEYQQYPPQLKNVLGTLIWEECFEQNTYRTKNIREVFDTLEYYFKNPHGNIIWDDNILETLNSDGIELDEDYVNTLDSMFASNDSDNIKLAIEMMANVNLNKHGLQIALLLNKWKGAMNWGMGNTSSQAYKTLDRYFINKKIHWKYDYRAFSTGLYQNYSNDTAAKEIIEKFVLENINRYLAEGSSECLQINSFKISLKK